MSLRKALTAVGEKLRRGTRRSEEPASPPGGDGELGGELEPPEWLRHATELLETGFWSMARRLPRLTKQAFTLAWRSSRIDTVLAIGLTVASGAFTTFGLLATQQVLQALFASGPTVDRVYAAVPALIVVAAAAATRAGLGIAAGHAQARLAPQVERRVELDLFAVTTRVELAAFDDTGFADELERARGRGVQAPRWLVDRSVNLLTGLVNVTAVSITLAVIHPLLLPVLLAASLPNGWAAIRAARIEYTSLYARVTRRRRIWLLAELMASRHTAAELRSNELRDFLLREYDTTTRVDTQAGLDVINRQSRTRLVGSGLAGTATAGVYVILGLLLAAEWVPLAAAGTAVLALQAGRTALDLAIRNVNGLYEEGLYHTDLVTFTARAAARTLPSRPVATVTAPREITLADVEFRYPDTDSYALRKVSLTIRRGQTIALVGENGSGKSTLAKLVAGLYQPTAGTIAWDGTDLAAVTPEAVRDHVAVIAQDYWRWPFTARRNITIGRHAAAADTAPVEAAAQAAGAHDMITKLPRGYDTLLDRTFSGGHDLSGGQWQRLATARGFYRDAAVLICDEPSANLDARAEHTLFQHLHDPNSDRITILITHRLANVRHADHIYVIHDGAVTEHGTHAALTTAGGRYHQLFSLQAAGYRSREVPQPDVEV